MSPRWVSLAERWPEVREVIVHVPRPAGESYWDFATHRAGLWTLADGTAVEPTHWLEMSPPETDEEPRSKRPAPEWSRHGHGAIWARRLDEYDLTTWLQPVGWVSTDGSLWDAFVGHVSVGQHRTLDAAKAAVDAQLRLEGWDT